MRILVGGAMSVLIVLMIFAAVVIGVSEWRVPKANLRWLLDRALPEGMSVDFEDAGARVLRRSGSLLSRDLEFEATKLCFRKGRQTACFDRFDFKARVGWSLSEREFWRPRVQELGPVQALGGKAFLDLRGLRSPPSNVLDKGLDLQLFERLRLAGSFVDVRSLRVRAANGKAYRTRLRLEPENARPADAVVAKLVDLREAGGRFRMNLEARLRFGKGPSRAPTVDGIVSIKTALPGPVRSLDLNGCAIHLEPSGGSGRFACESGQARLEVSGGHFARFVKDRRFFVFRPRFRLQVSHLELAKKRSADFLMNLDLDHMNLFSAKASCRGRVEQTIGRAVELTASGEFDGEARRFQEVVSFLAAIRYSVPAPFNVLDGSVSAHVELALDRHRLALAYKGETALDGDGQSAHFVLAGTSTAPRAHPRRMAAEASLRVRRLWLSTPRLDVAKPPRLALDRRFGSFAEEAPAVELPEPPLDLKLRILTENPQSIRIASNLTSTPVPIGLDLLYDTRLRKKARMIGTIFIGRTPIDIFGRDAVLEGLRIERLANGANRIDGRAQVHYLEYDIAIRLLGTARHPVVRFSSSPPVSDDQIIAVLLFGRPMEELSGDRRGSVANMKAIFADAALGLSSLYFLSRTPIENLGYNAERGLVTANIGLGGGAAIELGAGKLGSGAAASNTVGFRKRLGPHLLFRTDFEELGESGRRIMSALIEWSRRF